MTAELSSSKYTWQGYGMLMQQEANMVWTLPVSTSTALTSDGEEGGLRTIARK